MKTKFVFRFIALISLSLMVFATANAQKRLCALGDATRYGWDKNNASPLIQDPGNVSVFHYNAWLNAGDLKFILENQNDWVPTWNKGANDTTLVKRLTYADPDEKFHISTAGNYTITLDTTLLSIHITPMSEPTRIDFNTVFMVGSASPNGWSINNSTELVKNPSNPWEFSYTGYLSVGEFKFPVNRNQNWGQDFFMKVSDNLMFLGTSPDTKWNITEAGNYLITMNTASLTISINHLPENAGAISGATTVCQGQTQVTYSVPSIPYATYYTWILPAGTTGSSITNSINVDFGASVVSGNISVRGNNVYGAGAYSSLGITVNPLPGSAGTISGQSTVFQGQNQVVYSVAPVANAVSYVWTLPAGASGSSSGDSIVVDFSASAVSGVIQVQAINSCGSGVASAPFNVTVTASIPENTTVANVIIKNGQSECYNAQNTVTIAGDGNFVSVQDGGIMHVIAGMKILMEPGTIILHGGYFEGKIATGSSYCNQGKSLVSSALTETEQEKSPQYSAGEENLTPRVYPNPTSGEVTIEFPDKTPSMEVTMKLFGSRGEKLADETISNAGKFDFSMAAYKPGLYILHLVSDNKVEIIKIIRK